MEAHESLRALIDATLNAIKKIIAGIITVLLASKNDLKTVCLELMLAITLCAGIRLTVTSIESDYTNVACRTSCISRDTIRRIGALQRLLNRLGLNSISVPICIINRCALGVHRAICDGE